MLVSNIPLYIVLMKKDSLGRIIRLFTVLVWDNRDDSLVAVIPSAFVEDDYKKAYPVDDPLIVAEYGHILEYVLESNLSNAKEKWNDWTTDGDGDRLFFIFGIDF